MNNMTRLLILLVAVMFAVPTSAETLEVRGGVVNLASAQTVDLVWNACNFGALWYDLDDDLVTEHIRIAANTLIGPNTDRTIDKNCLSYQIFPVYQQYELHENEGLTVNGDTGYYIEGWMAEGYVAINNNADKLSKPLVEFEDDDKKTLAVGEAWALGGGFALTAENLSCPCEAPSLCDSCTLSLSKNGVKLDEQIIYVNTSNEQDRVYTYTPDIGGEERVPVFSCYVDAVYNGTESDIVQVQYVFLIDNDVLEIETGDRYGVMEVMTASSTNIILENDETTIDLDEGTTEHIMGSIYFKTADDPNAIRFYPYVIEEEPGNYEIHGHVVDLMFNSAQTADIVWNAYNFAGFWYDLDNDLMTEELRLMAGTLDATYDRTIDEDCLSYCTSPVYQEYELYTNEGLTVDSDHPGGDTGYWIEGWIGERYVAIDGKADKLTKLLVEFDRYDIKTLNSGDTWDLGDGLVLKLMGINDAGNMATLQLFKNGVPLEGSLKCIDTSTGIKQDRVYTYLKDVADEYNIPIFSCYVAAVFKEGSTSYVQLKYVFLIDDDVIEIETTDTYGVMEVMTASSSEVILRNEDSIDLDEDTTEHIMGDLYFRIADDPHTIRFYPFVERTIPHIPETLTVNNSGGADYTSIQAAIHAAESRDTIMVYNGTYHENVRVNKQLTLIGIGMPVVDGGWGDSAIEVTADHCTIDGFRVIHGYPYGIFLCYSSNNMLSNNTASNNSVNGIHLFSSSNNMLSSNTASNNPYSGIVLYKSNNHNTLENNTANLNNYFGIKLSNSSSNTLKNNTANSNEMYGISLRGSSDDNTLYHNDLINNGLYNAYDDGTNTWDSGSEGNYYSDYTGTDPDGDGIGEDPYPIPGGSSIDRFPLMHPWTGDTPQKGDLNGDNRITPADAAIALEIAVGGSASCDPATFAAADVSGDDMVTSLDALMILQAAAGGIAL